MSTRQDAAVRPVTGRGDAARRVDRAEAIGRRMSRRRLAAELSVFTALAVLTAVSAAWVKQHAVTPPPLMHRAGAAAVARPPIPFPVDMSPVPKPPVAADPSQDIDPADLSVRWFDGRPVRPARTVRMVVTAYSPDAASCAPFDDGITASLKSVFTNGMRLVAADPRVLPIGSLVSVPGYASGEIVPVLDKGGAIKGNRLDVLYPTHGRALRWGKQTLTVTVWEPVDG